MAKKPVYPKDNKLNADKKMPNNAAMKGKVKGAMPNFMKAKGAKKGK